MEANSAKSVHALAFTSDEELLLAESSGVFTVEEWNKILETGQRVCCHEQAAGTDTAMSGDGIGSPSINAFIRSVMETKAAADLHWE